MALLAVAALSAVSCCSAVATRPAEPLIEEPAPAPTGAVVVRNGTLDALELRIEGRLVTTLPPNGAYRSGRLQTGVYRVVAADEERGVRYERLVRVRADHEVRWEVRPRWSALLVSNRTREPVRVEIDGADSGRVRAEADRRFTSIPVGLRRVVAQGPRGTVLSDAVLSFREGSVTRLELQPVAPPPPEPAELIVNNQTDGRVVVSLDGRRLGRVRSGAQKRFAGLLPGQSDLEARTRAGTLVAATHVYLSPGSVTEWDVVPVTSRVRITNRSEQRYLLLVDGQPMGELAPGRTRLYAGIRPGRRTIEARPTDGGVARRRELVCPPEGVAEWIINPPPRADLEVRNGTGSDLRIFLDGERLGHVRPGFTMRFGALAAGPHRLEARSDDAPPHVREVTLAAGEVFGWMIGPRPASLRVKNDWEVPAIVVLDGRRLGRVPAHGERSFDGLVPGRRVVRAERAGGPAQRDEIVLHEGRETPWLVRQDAPATLRIVNRNAVPVTATVAGRSVGRIPPRQDKLVRDVRPGVVEVSARAPSGADVRETLDLAPGEIAVWAVRLPKHASLRVVNQTSRPIVVEIDGRRLGRVSSGRTETFGELSSGGHTLRALTDGEVVREHRAILATGETVSWVVTPKPRARLRVHNAGPQRVIVAVGGQRLGEVRAGNTVVFRDLEPRTSVAVATTREGREVGRSRLELRPGEEARWEMNFEPETGDLIVRNDSDRPIRVRSGDDTLGVVAAGGRGVFVLPRGTHKVKAYDTAPRPALVAAISARIGPRPFRWVVEPARTTLRLVNRASEALDVVVPGTTRFRLQTGGSWSGKVRPGRIDVRGEGVESGARYDLRGDAEAGEELALGFETVTATLVVENQDEEALEVSVDGRRKRRVGVGAVVRIQNLPLGAHGVSVRGLRSGRIEKRKVVVKRKGAKVRFGPK